MKKSFLIILLGLVIVGCKKESTLTEIQKDQKMAEDNNQAESYADDISVMSDEAYSHGKLQSRGGNGGSGIMGDTVKVTLNKADSTITIDFGTGVTGKDNKVRKGKIIVKFSNGYRKTGSVVSQTFDNYYVNDNKVEGTRSVTFLGDSSNGMPRWKIQSNLTITKTDGIVITWNSTRIRTMTDGYTTPLNWYDDAYTISGDANGKTSNGDNYTLTIDKPLVYKVSFGAPSICRYIIDGKLTYVRGKRTISLDYGYGGTTSCDNQAELNYNGTKIIVTL